MVIMIISLYMSRVILDTLGVSDYGIYNVVGGFVTMFTLLSGSLSNAISRFITFELGKGDKQRLAKVFSTSVTVQILLSIAIGVLLEIIGIWFLNYKMQMPVDRLNAANWVLQCSILTFILNLISIPYNGCIIAHEHMTAYAYIGVLDVMLKFVSVLFLYITFYDKLIIYAILLAGSALIVRLVYGIYCSHNFEECKYRFFFDKPLIKQMIAMASWNFLGASGGVLNNQGVNVLINLFFGVTVNAARGIATQVNSAVQAFAGSFITALNPQITKSYAQGKIDEMRKLFYRGSKVSYFLMLIIALPIIVEAPTILQIWLKTVPEYTIVFVRYTMLISLTTVLSNILFTIAMANGNIKRYQLWMGTLSLSIFAITYIAFKLNANVTACYLIAFLMDIVIVTVRIIIVNRLVDIDLKAFVKMVLFRIIIVTILSACVSFGIRSLLHDFFFSTPIVIAITIISICFFVFIFGLNRNEREFIINKISTYKKK